MKKFALTGALLILMLCANGQRSIDRLFEKYSDNDDFTCISVNGNLLNIVAGLEDDDDADDNGRDIKAKITGVRILTRKNHNSDEGNFHDIVFSDLDLHGYDEFMRVKESDQDFRVLVRTQGRRITEFLLVAGGDDNAIIQVKGDMSVSDARRLCDHARKNHGSDIF